MANFNAMQVGMLIKALHDGGTVDDIAFVTGYSTGTVYRYIQTWHRQRLIFVEQWHKSVNDVRHRAWWKLKVDAKQNDAPKPSTRKLSPK